jgi:hypothetical protein
MDKATSLNAWHTPPSDKDASCAVSSFGEFLGLVKRCPSNRFIAIFGHVAIGIVSVGSVLVAGIDSTLFKC